jgi:hypothetical protein
MYSPEQPNQPFPLTGLQRDISLKELSLMGYKTVWYEQEQATQEPSTRRPQRERAWLTLVLKMACSSETSG